MFLCPYERIRGYIVFILLEYDEYSDNTIIATAAYLTSSCYMCMYRGACIVHMMVKYVDYSTTPTAVYLSTLCV